MPTLALTLTLMRAWPAQVVSEFHSRQDLVDTVLASCHLPAYSDGRISREWRGKRCAACVSVPGQCGGQGGIRLAPPASGGAR